MQFVPVVSALITIAILEFAWVTINYNKYNALIKSIQKDTIPTNFVKLSIVFLFIILAVVVFMVPCIERDMVNLNPVMNALKNGGLLGLAMFGLFNFGNYALFKNWNLYTAVIDTLWGGFVFFVGALIISVAYLLNLIRLFSK